MASPTVPQLADRLGFEPKRVVVMRGLRSVGDMLTAVPALRALRAALPTSRIELIGMAWAESFVERFAHLLDGLIEFPGFPGVPDQPYDARESAWFLVSRQTDHLDLAIQLHGNGLRTNPFVALLGAKRSAGFYLPGQFCPDPPLFMPYPGRGPEVLRLLVLTDFLGMARLGEHLEFPLHERDLMEIDADPRSCDLPHGGYACYAPGAAEPYRRWQPERFAEVADALSREGLPAVLVGSALDREASAAVASHMRQPVADMTGRILLGGSAALLARAAVVITNDSGASHLADAVGAPSVTVFLGTGADRWAPLDPELHVTIAHRLDDPDEPYGGRVLEDRCLRDACEYPQLHGYAWPKSDIAASEVLAAARQLLTSERVRERALPSRRGPLPGVPQEARQTT